MKQLINLLICLFRGHKWKHIARGYMSEEWCCDGYICTQCGKIKEEVI